MSFGPWGNEASASTTFSGTWITDPDDHEGTLIILPIGGVGKQHSTDRAKTALQFVGRTYPVYDVGEARAESINVETFLLGDDEGTPVALRRLRSIVGDSQIVLFRDGRGRKMYGMPTDFVLEDLEQGSYKCSFLMNRVDYDEELPELLDVPVAPADFQVQNFAVTVDTGSSSVLLNWDDVAGATLYTVYLDGVPVIQTETSLGSYGPLVPGSYSMWARATVAGVEQAPSTTQGFVIEAQPDNPVDPGGGGTPTPSTVPQSFVAAPHTGANVVDFTWTAVAGATSYKLYERRSPNGVANGTYTGTSATRGSPTPLSNNDYDYWLTAIGPWGESVPSQHQQFTLPYTGPGGGGTLPTPPVALGLGYNDGQLHYNLGMGFTSGHVNIAPAELYAWSGSNITALTSGNFVFTKVDTDGSIVVSLEAPLDGGTTSGLTNYARCEYREQDEDGDGNISFNPTSGMHYQEGYSRPVILPPLKPGVVVNQAHDAADDTCLIKTKKSGTKIVVVTDVLGTEAMVLDSDYKVGELMWTRIEINNSIMKVYYKKGGGTTTTAALTRDLTGDITSSGWYFKFGSYNQSNRSTDPTGRIVTEVHGWRHWHTGWPTPIDAAGGAPTVSAGADATVSPGGTFSRTGTVTTGSGITARGWRLVGAGTSGDPGTAAFANAWGSPDALSDEFNYTGTPDPAKWSLYDGPGHASNGLRVPARCTVASGMLSINGLAGSANTGGMAHSLHRQYGKWEIRARARYTSAPTNTGTLSPAYHPVAIIWPTNDVWPGNGEYDFMENDKPGLQAQGAFLHYPSLNGTDTQVDVTDFPVDTREFHNYAIEWTSSYIKLYVDGVLWATHSGGAISGQRKNLQAMTEGQLTLQLDAFASSGMNASQMDVEWARAYPLVPVGTNPGLATTDTLNWTAPTTPGTYTLEYFATNSAGTATDQVVVTVSGTPVSTLVYPETFDDGTPYSTFGPGQTIVNVSGSSALTTALASAAPGQIITLASGTYTGDFLIANKAGTSANGIVVRAASSLGAVFASGSSFTVNNCTNVTIEGLDFPFDQEGETLQIRGNSQNVRYMRCRVGPSSFTNSGLAGDYVYVGDDVKHFRIGYCTFRNKGTNGNVIRVYGNFDTFVGCKYGRIDHNLIDTVGDQVGNDKECIRYGVSTMSRTDAYAVIERNVILNAKAEPEVISGKMGHVIQRGNTILRCAGGIVIRHGRNSKQQSNYVVDKVTTTATAGLKSGGSRFYDSGHVIEDNYFEGLASTDPFQRALIVDTGDAGDASTNLAAHWNVVGAEVQRNVIINCTGGIYIGDNYANAPAGCSIIDNDVINSGGAAVTTIEPLVGDSTVSNNNYYASTGAGSYTADGDSIYRKAGRGPKITYLDPTDVGHAADLTETDRTGVAV